MDSCWDFGVGLGTGDHRFGVGSHFLLNAFSFGCKGEAELSEDHVCRKDDVIPCFA